MSVVVRLRYTDGSLPRGDITMTEAHILRIDSLPVVDRGNGIKTTPLVTKEIGSKQITTGLTRFPAGAKVPLHSHNCDEQVTILEGEAEAEVDGERHRLKPFDTTLVPADKPHRFVNVGTSHLTIMWIYTSSDVTRTFTETGETVAHLPVVISSLHYRRRDKFTLV